MTQYNLIQALFLSFYSKKLYRDVANNWGGKVFLYLLFLLAITWIIPTYQIQHVLNNLYVKVSNDFVPQIPLITIKNGQVITPENRPYIIIEPQTNNRVAIIDTSGKYKNFSDTKMDKGILMTKTQVISKANSDETKIINISDQLNVVVNPLTLNEYVKSSLGYAWIILFSILLFFSYIYHIIQLLICSIIGKILTLVFDVSLTYTEIMQITIVAITPTLILMSVIDFFNIQFSHQLIWYFLLFMTYLIYGIFANKPSH